jgi:hypothetical protein
MSRVCVRGPSQRLDREGKLNPSFTTNCWWIRHTREGTYACVCVHIVVNTAQNVPSCSQPRKSRRGSRRPQSSGREWRNAGGQCAAAVEGGTQEWSQPDINFCFANASAGRLLSCVMRAHLLDLVLLQCQHYSLHTGRWQ